MITGTQLVFGLLGILGVYSMFRALIYFIRSQRSRGSFINLPGVDDFGSMIAFGCGCVDLLLATLMWQPQTTHLFVVGCIALVVCLSRTIFGTALLLKGDV